MSNDAPVTGGDAATPVAAESTSADSADAQSIADAFDAQALGEVASAPGDGGEGVASTTSDPLDAFIQSNYRGDRNAFVQSLYEQRAQGKRQADEISELRGALLQQRTPARDTEADFKSRFESDPDVQSVNRDINAIDKRVEHLNLAQVKLGEEAATISNDIARLDGQLVHADDIDKPKLLHELSTKKNRLSNIETKWETNNTALEGLSDRRSDKISSLQKLHRSIRDDMVREQRSNENKQVQHATTRSNFVKAFDTVAQQYGLVPKTEHYNYYRETVRAQLVDYLDSLDDNSPEVFDAAGMRDAVTMLMSQAERVGAIRKNGISKPTKPATPRPTIMPRRVPVTPAEASHAPAAPTARTTEDLLRDPDYVRRRADHIISTAGRRMRQR